ncbi:sigma-70 family RNA polymerase sigma factor [Romboutsia sp.]|uniref:sigma-70 family RNA polymerase sigma factor n=1 Tax=Romboutsia sp. TaxID=1965302 RepID=UPI003F37214A
MGIIKKLNIFTSNSQADSEEILIKKSKNGCNESFEKLLIIYESYLYKMAYLHVKNEQDALDIYQETILKAYMNISNLRKNNLFKTWIIKILINNIYSKNKHDSKYSNVDFENYIIDYTYSDIEKNIDLYAAIDVLDEKYKTPIILHYFYDYTISQISDITNSNENTIKTNLKRAKKKMYDILKEGENE